jgi:small nuclear ribonucleoprotein (snRNP)-like protein
MHQKLSPSFADRGVCQPTTFDIELVRSSKMDNNGDNNDSSSTRSVDLVRRLLKKKIRCTLSDGRIVVGEMQCVDKLKNFILHSVQETTIQKSENGEEDAIITRKLGVVMVL